MRGFGTCDARRKLYTRLCRELAKSERSSMVSARREARRLGDATPAQALLAIASHATSQRPRYFALMCRRQPVGLKLGQLAEQAFSALRRVILDKLIDAERSYLATVLGLRHGLNVARLLREVASREGDVHLVGFCDEWLVERHALLEQAEAAMTWFADRPSRTF